jgi:HAD superfamily hydrolase (TIGR01450 family)
VDGVERVDGVLLDIDGVLTTSWRPLPGAVEALAWLRSSGVALRLLTNTTTHSRGDLARTLREAGIDVEPDEIVTAVVGTATFLREHHPAASVFLLSDGDATEDLEGVAVVDLADDTPRPAVGAGAGASRAADVVVIGGACDASATATSTTPSGS